MNKSCDAVKTRQNKLNAENMKAWTRSTFYAASVSFFGRLWKRIKIDFWGSKNPQK